MSELEQIEQARPRRFRPYPEYKDSGVEWLGKIPAHWEVRRLKFVAKDPIKNGIGEAGAYDDPDWPRYVRITDIAGPRELRDDTFKSLPPDVARQAPFQVGDLLLAAVGATFGKSYLHVHDIGPACFAGYLVRFSPSHAVDSGYAAYWTESSAYWALVQSRVVQATIQNFSAAKYKDLSLPLPPSSEQRAIAAFLDRETARIDALVARKERLIELLQEKRTALITRAVTKGLEPTVPMKDSGIEWLGEIPAHWEVKRLRHVLHSVKNGTVAHQLDYGETKYRVTRIETISHGVIDLSRVGFVEWTADLEDYRLKRGDVLLSHINSIPMLGNCALYDLDEPLYGGMNLLRLRPAVDVSGAWLWNWLRSVLGRESVRSLCKPAINQASVPIGALKNIVVCVPPSLEQRAIAAFLDRETAKIDALVAKVREAIARLKEFRTALISAAVTGKIDVRAEVSA